jgi:hypothetical protein
MPSTLTQAGDHCTKFPEGWWAHCCAAHDIAYVDGTRKLIADVDLLVCVSTAGTEWWQHVLSFTIGGVMFAGVSLFGMFYYEHGQRDKR